MLSSRTVSLSFRALLFKVRTPCIIAPTTDPLCLTPVSASLISASIGDSAVAVGDACVPAGTGVGSLCRMEALDVKPKRCCFNPFIVLTGPVRLNVPGARNWIHSLHLVHRAPRKRGDRKDISIKQDPVPGPGRVPSKKKYGQPQFVRESF